MSGYITKAHHKAMIDIERARLAKVTAERDEYYSVLDAVAKHGGLHGPTAPHEIEKVLCTEFDKLRRERAQARDCVALLQSVVKSGEAWTTECQEALDLAMGRAPTCESAAALEKAKP